MIEKDFVRFQQAMTRKRSKLYLYTRAVVRAVFALAVLLGGIGLVWAAVCVYIILVQP